MPPVSCLEHGLSYSHSLVWEGGAFLHTEASSGPLDIYTSGAVLLLCAQLSWSRNRVTCCSTESKSWNLQIVVEEQKVWKVPSIIRVIYVSH